MLGDTLLANGVNVCFADPGTSEMDFVAALDRKRQMLNLDNPTLDWVSLARGFGAEAVAATSCEAFVALFSAALSRRGPFLIEARLA
ncbi:hypothetical protein ACQKGL_13565 [Ensifer adhaerens]|uniref:hypothetical protein n=1 Tax=Ensifer adhaerens TaxID=106592 RepID=UPI003CFEF6F7